MQTRRHLAISAIAACAARRLAGSAAYSASVEGGKFDGVQLAGGINAWHRIAFAATPVRALRWREPRTGARLARTAH